MCLGDPGIARWDAAPLLPGHCQRHPGAYRELPCCHHWHHASAAQQPPGPTCPTRPPYSCQPASSTTITTGHRGRHRHCSGMSLCSRVAWPADLPQLPRVTAALRSAVQANHRPPGPCGVPRQGQRRQASAHAGPCPIWLSSGPGCPGLCWAGTPASTPMDAGGPRWTQVVLVKGHGSAPLPQVPRSGSFPTLPSHGTCLGPPQPREQAGEWTGPRSGRRLPGLPEPSGRLTAPRGRGSCLFVCQCSVSPVTFDFLAAFFHYDGRGRH